MAPALRKILTFGSMLLPYGVHELRRRHKQRIQISRSVLQALHANRELAGCHNGQRCFILGNGPSAKAQDLTVLAGETVISVSNGYLHADFQRFAPKYHVVPQITFGTMTEDQVARWFAEMHENLGEAELFLNETEAGIVAERKLFAGRKVHYVALRKNFDDIGDTSIIDIGKPVPRIDSVPVLALMIAMHMGFKNIVLLGVDHDSWRTGYYTYAFDLKTQAGMDFSVTSDGKILSSNYDTFQSLARLWRQYRRLRMIAVANGVQIINAGIGGELDEFDRIPLDLLLSQDKVR
ncbi:alpha-2,3-sialyltransferase domain-containing protein [Rhizobium phaseoli]|nr:alpha-2,3-sialyltransferase domain-containing protein [Rhizobium phaseoli]